VYSQPEAVGQYTLTAQDIEKDHGAARDLVRARHRLSKLLLRQDLVWQGTAWTQRHERSLRSLTFEHLGVRLAFDEAFDAVLTFHARPSPVASTTLLRRKPFATRCAAA
jgi:hypothetical protein